MALSKTVNSIRNMELKNKGLVEFELKYALYSEGGVKSVRAHIRYRVGVKSQVVGVDQTSSSQHTDSIP